jgi:hypothetical protein
MIMTNTIEPRKPKTITKMLTPEPSAIPAPIGVPAVAPEMAAMMEMMKQMQNTITDLQAQKPAEVINIEDMAARRIRGDKAMDDLAVKMSDQLRTAFGYVNETDPEGYEEGKQYATIFNTMNRDVTQQCMWTLADSCARQYFWTRRNADRARVKLGEMMDKYNHLRNRSNNTDGVSNDSMYEKDSSPHKDYERAEQNVDYHTRNEMPYQLMSMAARILWDEINEEAAQEWEDIHGKNGRPFNAPNEPNHEANENAYVQYLEKEANTRELEKRDNDIARIESARLDHYDKIIALTSYDDGKSTTSK